MNPQPPAREEPPRGAPALAGQAAASGAAATPTATGVPPDAAAAETMAGAPLSPVKQALLEIRELRARLAAVDEAAHEPVAVAGLACRLPGGAHDEAALWQVLSEGRDAVGPVPRERWDIEAHYDDDPDRPGTMWTREGGYLDDDVAGFDAAFFGIAPLEAISMDPQQRMMLELAWHALEDAAIAPDSLAGSRTGVFIGVGNSDYGRALFGEAEHVDAHAGSGGSLAVVAGRIAYVLGLQGPALTVDTACSSSLAAVHLACQSLRRGECDLALVGGINLILSPAAHIAFTKARMMSRDGRCKTFDAAADGYGRGEGAVMLVLQRDGDARAAGARRLALIRGSALNQDGRSGGLTAPNGPAQEAVIRAALADARLAPADIDVVEAHGTGTPLGDPIELQALAHALGEGHDAARPLIVGSCKTNFGHLEAAAGVAGLAKVVAALRRGQVPPHLHFARPNPLLDWASMPLQVPTRLQPWPRHGDAPARAGVSSFGFSGTNAHVIVEEARPGPAVAPAAGAAAHEPRPLHLLTLAARDEAALRALALRWQVRLAEPDAAATVADLAFTANTGRARLPRRLAVRGADAGALHRGLAAWLAGRHDETWHAGHAAGTPPRIAFVFPGQGAQYAGMAAGLYRRAPAFRAALDRCAAVLDPLLGVPLAALLFDPAHAAGLDDTARAQPALFAVEVSLAALWESLGIVPAVVLGHSLGEYAAACVAGIFPLEDALRALVHRGRLTASLPGEGAMISVQAGAGALGATMQSLGTAAGGPLEFAAFNGAAQTVVSGARPAIDALTRRLDADGTPWRALRISHAFHSSFVEPALAPYGEALAGVRFGDARCAIVSNLEGRAAEQGEMATSSYWLQQMRAPVRFAQGLRALLAQGVTHVIEVGPHPVLLGLAAEEHPDADGGQVAWLPTLRRGDDADTDLVDSLQRLFVAGARIDWAAFDRGHARRRLAAPLMPFQHRRFWIERPLIRVAGATAQSAAGGTSAWPRLAAALGRQSDCAPIGTHVHGYAERWAVLERLTAAHAAQVLRDAGLFAAAGEAHDTASVQRHLGAKDSYAHLLERWLERLAARGWLRAEAGDGGNRRFIADRALPDPGLAAAQEAARAALADNPAQLAYMQHCGRLLEAVIRGRESPLETLFPGGSFELAEGIYERSTPMRYINALAAAGLEALAAARGAAPLRMLEIGAGTGSTTRALLPVLQALPSGHVDYCYTDVTPVFFELARAKFAAHAFVRFAEFDLERDAAAQGFAPGSFDVVFAANAVHAVRDLRAALRTIRSLLVPGGVLILVESTEHLAWYDITTGLIEGWQHFADDLRTDNPLLPAATWQRALRDAGFDETGAWPPEGHEAAAMGQRVIAARAAGADHAHAPAGAGGAATAPHRSAATAAGGAVDANRPAGEADAAHEALRRRLAAALPDEQLELLREGVRDTVVAVLRLSPQEPPAHHDRLMDLGMDSLMAVQLRNRFARLLGLPKALPATLLFDHPTIDALARFLQPLAAAAQGGAAAEGALPATAPASASTTASATTSPTTPPTAPPGVVPTHAPLGAERVAQMSDEEIEQLLLQRLDKAR